MEAAFPPLLSGIADRIMRRPPSLQDLVIIVGYADDYAWFAELVRRIFPQEAESVLSTPGSRNRAMRFGELFEERHFPLYAPFVEHWTEAEGDEPPWSWLRRGIPFDLAGFGYDALHEVWDCCSEGIAALALLVRPPAAFFYGTDEIRTAWLESAAERIPEETLTRIPPGGIPMADLKEAVEGTRFEGAAKACSWVFAETGNFFLDHCYDDGWYDGCSDPWEEDVIAEGTAEWSRARAWMDSVGELTGWLEEDLPGRFDETLDFILPRVPENEKEGKEHAE